MSITKKALLIGINYRNTSSELSGCINDVHQVKNMLIQHLGYSENNITMLTDDTHMKPTRENILHSIKKILSEAKHNSNLKNIWIHYSGHGTYLKDKSGDEADQRDEALVPLDHEENGLIIDDELYALLPIVPARCKVIFIMDSCYSGSVLDLRYQLNLKRKNKIKFIKVNQKGKKNKKEKIKGNIIMISGCRDDQTSIDAYGIGGSETWSGAMTTSLLHVLQKRKYQVSCWKLIQRMRAFLRSPKNYFEQVPQLSASRPIKPRQKFVKGKQRKKPFKKLVRKQDNSTLRRRQVYRIFK